MFLLEFSCRENQHTLLNSRSFKVPINRHLSNEFRSTSIPYSLEDTSCGTYKKPLRFFLLIIFNGYFPLTRRIVSGSPDPQVPSFINLIPSARNSKNLNLKFRRSSLSELCGKNSSKRYSLKRDPETSPTFLCLKIPIQPLMFGNNL